MEISGTQNAAHALWRDLGGFVELGASVPVADANDVGLGMNSGLSLQLADDLALDGGTRVGLNDAVDQYAFFLRAFATEAGPDALAGARAAQPAVTADATAFTLPLSVKSASSNEASMPRATPSVFAAAMCVSARGMSPPLGSEAPVAESMSEAP